MSRPKASARCCARCRPSAASRSAPRPTITPARSTASCTAIIGEEAVAVGVCAALNPDDQIISTHRGHGHCIAKGADLNRMMAELYGRETGYCKGKGGSMHIADFDIGMLGANGIVAGGISIVTGAGLAAQMDGNGRVAVSLLRRRRLQCRTVSRVPQHRGDLEAADDLRLREQPLCGADRGRWRRMPCPTWPAAPPATAFRASSSTATTSSRSTRRPARPWPARAPARARR